MKRRRRISASKAGLALACSYWLDPAVPLPERGPTDDADLEASRSDGETLHARIQHDDGSPEYLDVCNDERVAAARRYLEARLPEVGRLMREPAFGSNGLEARYLGTGRESYDQASDCDVTGTADIVMDLGDGRWLVADWKSGEHGAIHARAQMRALGALVLAAFGGTEALLDAVHLPVGGDARVSQHGEIDTLDGDALLHRLHAIEPGPPKAGDHCSDYYCPLRGKCPAYVEAAALVVHHEPVTELIRERRNPLVEGVVDDETARIAVDLLPLVEKRFEEVKRDLKRYAEAKPTGELDLGDGRRYAPVTQSRKSIDGDAALALAERSGASLEDLSACMRTSTFQVWKRLGKRKAG